MKLFETLPDENHSHDYYFDVCHRWGLPGVDCDVCGWKGSTVSAAYPNILLPEGVDEGPYQNRWPVRPMRLKELIVPIRSVIAPELAVGAGTEFGPLQGTGRGRFGDFAWANMRTPLISTEALTHLSGRGLKIGSSRTAIQLPRGRIFDYREVAVEPRARLDLSGLPSTAGDRCPACGLSNLNRLSTGWDRTPKILAGSIPAGTDLFGVQELDGLIIATEQFVDEVRKLELSDIKFVEVSL